MNFKCSECPGLLLRSLGEKKQHKNYHKASIKEQETVKGAGSCDGRAGGDQGAAGDSQEDVIGGQEAVVAGQEPEVVGQEPVVAGQETVRGGQGTVVAGQETGGCGGIVDQVYGWEGSEN